MKEMKAGVICGLRETYKDPCPARLASYTSHLSNRCCEETAKGPCECGGREEDGGADTEFGALVPAGQVVVHARKEARLGDTKPPSLCTVSMFGSYNTQILWLTAAISPLKLCTKPIVVMQMPPSYPSTCAPIQTLTVTYTKP